MVPHSEVKLTHFATLKSKPITKNRASEKHGIKDGSSSVPLMAREINKKGKRKKWYQKTAVENQRQFTEQILGELFCCSWANTSQNCIWYYRIYPEKVLHLGTCESLTVFGAYTLPWDGEHVTLQEKLMGQEPISKHQKFSYNSWGNTLSFHAETNCSTQGQGWCNITF